MKQIENDPVDQLGEVYRHMTILAYFYLYFKNEALISLSRVTFSSTSNGIDSPFLLLNTLGKKSSQTL